MTYLSSTNEHDYEHGLHDYAPRSSSLFPGTDFVPLLNILFQHSLLQTRFYCREIPSISPILVYIFLFLVWEFSAGEAIFGPTRIRACYMGGERRDKFGQAKCVRLYRSSFLLFFEKDMWWWAVSWLLLLHNGR